ncbi:MAG: alpha/beta fold hydrolase [Flavitalea sp.]
MQHVYCLSGLGADERIFCKLKVPGSSFHYIRWVQPQANESIIDYAARLSSQIEHDNPILLGVSFGGMMAIEVAKLLEIHKVILISSVKSNVELPGWMKICGRYGFDRMLPSRPLHTIRPLKALRPIQNYFLGTESAEEKAIANQFRDTVDPLYLRWSINQVLNWKNEWQPETTFHLHGEKDHIFPLRHVKPTHVVPNAGHFMVMNKCREISEILNEII